MKRKSKTRKASDGQLLLPQLPTVVRTKSGGVQFNPSSEIWRYRDGVEGVTLDFRDLRRGLSPGLVHVAKCTLCWYAANRSLSHLRNSFRRLVEFANHIAASGAILETISSPELINYVGQLDTSHLWHFGALGGVLKRWRRLGYPGVEEDALLLLKQLRVPGNKKGEAVLTMDPTNGPLTEIEQEGVQSALNDAYAEGIVDTETYVLAWLYLLLGQRNKQYALLKVCDVRVENEANGAPRYSLMVPSAKKRHGEHRGQLVERPLIEQFGELLHSYAREVETEFEGILDDPTQAPLFPSRLGEPCEDGFSFHPTANSLGVRLTRVLEGLGVVSERTGQPINMHMRRARQTIATRAIEEGHGELVVAALLDQADTQQVGIYAAATPTVLDRINKAIALEMAPLAQAFAGVISSKSSGGTESEHAIIDLRIDRSGGEFGKCRSRRSCGFPAPIACYTCKSFRAWRDARHEAVLDFLLERREHLVKSADKKMASINDRTILAVAAVVRACQPARPLTHPKASDG